MSNETCILTARDFAALVALREQCGGRGDPVAAILKRKLDSARVVFTRDVPEDVATLSSRVTYNIDGRPSETRVISRDGVALPMGMHLPITTLRGLSLLGLAEGEEFWLVNLDGDDERVVLEKVLYQPEAAQRAMAAAGGPPSVPRQPALTLVQGARHQASGPATGRPDGRDPGPSAA